MHLPQQPSQGLVLGAADELLQSRVFTPRGREAVQTFPMLLGNQVLSFMDFYAQDANPPPPAAGRVRYHSATTQGFTRFEQDNEAATNLVLGRDNVFIAKNTSGGNITAGVPVYVTGSTGNVPNIDLAKADVIGTLPAVGLTLDAINANNFGQVMRLGVISNINTNAFTAGAQLWVSDSSAGTLTATRPVSPSLAQAMAVVLVKGVGNGSLLVITAPFIGGLESGTTAATFNGNASSATKLQTARTINGVSFDGTADITVTASPGPITGVTDGSSAASGIVGEVIQQLQTSVISPAASNSYKQIDSISVPAGDWDITCDLFFDSNGATLSTNTYGAFSTTTASAAGTTFLVDQMPGAQDVTSPFNIVKLGPFQKTLASPTTYYLNAKVGYAGSPNQGFRSRIFMRRMR